MNRRSFFTKLAVAAAGFAILPPATTYDRIWRVPFKNRKWIPNPEFETAEYEIRLMGRPDMALIESGYVSARASAFDLYQPLIRYRRENQVLVEVPRFIKS